MVLEEETVFSIETEKEDEGESFAGRFESSLWEDGEIQVA